MNIRTLLPKAPKIASTTKAQSPLRVTAIGSCRVLGPLRRNASSGFSLNQAGIYGYCHSSAEALQQIRVLQHELTLPQRLRPVVAPSITGGDISAAGHSASDLYFVELCSAKVLTVEGVSVQLNYLTRHFSEFFADRDRARSFWRLARQPDSSALLAFLADDPAYLGLDASDQAILGSTRLELATAESLTQDLSEIAARIKDVVFVTHFDAAKHDGSLLHARAEYLQMVRAVLDDLGLDYFDPSEDVRRFGQATALEDASASLSHYAPGFEERLGRKWEARYIAPRQTSVPPPSPERVEALQVAQPV